MEGTEIPSPGKMEGTHTVAARSILIVTIGMKMPLKKAMAIMMNTTSLLPEIQRVSVGIFKLLLYRLIMAHPHAVNSLSTSTPLSLPSIRGVPSVTPSDWGQIMIHRGTGPPQQVRRFTPLHQC